MIPAEVISYRLHVSFSGLSRSERCGYPEELSTIAQRVCAGYRRFEGYLARARAVGVRPFDLGGALKLIVKATDGIKPQLDVLIVELVGCEPDFGLEHRAIEETLGELPSLYAHLRADAASREVIDRRVNPAPDT